MLGFLKFRNVLFFVFITIAFIQSGYCFNVIRSSNDRVAESEENESSLLTQTVQVSVPKRNETTSEEMICSFMKTNLPEIDISETFPGLNFNATWITRKYFWLSDDFDFESRYQKHSRDILQNEKTVKVFIVPHSHNDPGWLNTYEQYYFMQTKHILDNAVQKLTELPQMTFVWSEITYLAKWWKEASPEMRQQFRKLVVEERRLEIATGGWVVPDEATSSLYSLLTELTEGQQWVKNHINTTAHYSWAIDPFGHSATHSHLLKESGMRAMVIQRLHYAWKHWLAEHRTEEFLWRPRWNSDGKEDIPCLSLPYDLYSIKHACGPEPQVCLKFDFRSIPFEYGENYGLMTPITKSNVRRSAQEIALQYYKTASLTRHNVILVPLGDDFRYDRPLEWEQQYANYMQLFSYINTHKERFRMEIGFGTLRDYFETVDQINKEENQNTVVVERPTLSGDFYPYGDVYVSGRPAYWTGFYGTRPYWKKFHRELENELRSAEILFTYANMISKRTNSFMELKILSYKYKDLIQARQHYSVFTHHDGLTGTSRMWTMDDYGDLLHAAYLKCISIQQQSLKIIYQKSPVRKTLPPMLAKDSLREKFELLATKMPLEVFGKKDDYATKVMVFNNLGWRRTELVKVIVKRQLVQVTDSKGAYIPSQVNPIFRHDEQSDRVFALERKYELVFLANLEALSTGIFKITGASTQDDAATTSTLAKVACDNCMNFNETDFPTEEVQEKTLVLENVENRVYFQSNGLLARIHQKKDNISVPVKQTFGMYKPTNRESGAYLLKPILTSEWKFFQTNYSKPHLIRISGPVMSQIIAIHHDRYETLKVNTTLVNTSIVPNNFIGPTGVLVETYVDFSRDYSNRAEAYMRLDTGLISTSKASNSESIYEQSESATSQPNVTKEDLVMFTDQNGLACEKRVHVATLPYEANSYPVTTMAYIQDEQANLRFSVLVDRTHGFCSMKNGRLETLIERKSLYDDGRGMAQGVTDSRPTVSTYVLLLESLVTAETEESSPQLFSKWQPTLLAHKTSLRQNYPPNLFVFTEPNEYVKSDLFSAETTISLISSPLPETMHLLNFRTISESLSLPVNVTDFRPGNDYDDEMASASALLNLQHLWHFGDDMRAKLCNVSRDYFNETEFGQGSPLTPENAINVESNATRVEDMLFTFKMNYLNATRVLSTSLTGVLDYSEQEPMFAAKPNSMDEVIPWASLLASYKLHFV